MHIRHTIEDAASPGSIGEPGVTGSHDIVDRCAYRLMRVRIRRNVIGASAQLIFRVIRADAYIVRSVLSQNPWCELIPRKRLDFMRRTHWVASFGVLHGLAI